MRSLEVSNNDRILSFLNDAKSKGFLIVPTIDSETHKKSYMVWVEKGDKEECYCYEIDGQEWLCGFPGPSDASVSELETSRKEDQDSESWKQ